MAISIPLIDSAFILDHARPIDQFPVIKCTVIAVRFPTLHRAFIIQIQVVVQQLAKTIKGLAVLDNPLYLGVFI